MGVTHRVLTPTATVARSILSRASGLMHGMCGQSRSVLYRGTHAGSAPREQQPVPSGANPKVCLKVSTEFILQHTLGCCRPAGANPHRSVCGTWKPRGLRRWVAQTLPVPYSSSGRVCTKAARVSF